MKQQRRPIPSGSPRPESQAKRPNVLIILLDTASARFLSCYGYPDNTTPRMDALASEGARFAYCYANGPWTPPSHASLFTGLPSIVHKMTHDAIDPQTKMFFPKVHFRGQFPTIASLLAEHGYQTVGICGNNWVGPDRSNICYGFQTWDDLRASRVPIPPPPAAGVPQSKRRQTKRDATTPSFLIWADTKYDPRRPYLAFLNYLTPHLPRRPVAKFRRRFAPGSVNPLFKKISSLNCFAHLWNGLLKEKDLPAFAALYAALMAQTDEQIRTLLDNLERRGMLDDTIVVLCADHGDENGEHHLLDHQLCVYNTLIHVPLIVWHPRLVPRGRVEKRPVQLSDVAPTLLNLTGLGAVRKQQKQMAGLDLLAEVPKANAPRPIVSEHGVPRLIIRNMGADVSPAQYEPYLRRLKCLIHEDWKYVWSSDGRDELYNLKTDFAETTNKIADQPEKARQLHDRLDRWVRAHGERLERDRKRPTL